MYLVDTDVISSTSPVSRSGRDEVALWLEENGADTFLSVITIAEIRRGVSFLQGMERHRKARLLDEWAQGLVEHFADRIIVLDAAVAERAGTLFGRVEAKGHQPGLADSCIAATADLRGLTVLTRNVRHFRLFGVPFTSPVAADRDA